MLLIACVMMACFSFVSLGQVQAPDYTFNFTTLGFFSEGQPTGGANSVEVSTWYLFIISLMSAILALVNIFCYRNFRLQKNLCFVVIMFVLVTAGIAAWLGYTAIPEGRIGWSVNVIEPLIAVVAVIMAYRMICCDERKIRSVDHFRD